MRIYLSIPFGNYLYLLNVKQFHVGLDGCGSELRDELPGADDLWITNDSRINASVLLEVPVENRSELRASVDNPVFDRLHVLQPGGLKQSSRTY